MPRKPTTQTKASQLVEKLAGLSKAPPLDEFALRRIVDEANALMQPDPAQAHMLLGSVAALRGDATETRRHYSIARKLDDTYQILFNYSLALSLVEEHGEALGLANKTLKTYPDNLDLIERAINAALASANFVVARNLSDRWHALTPDRPHPLFDTAQQLADAVEAGVFGEDAAQDVLRILTAIQRGENVRSAHFGFSVYNAADSFLYQRAVYATPTLAADLNERLADQIADRPDLMADPGLKFVAMFTAASSNGRKA